MTRMYSAFGLPASTSDQQVASRSIISGSAASGDIQLLEARLEDSFDNLQRFTELLPGDEGNGRRRPGF